MRASSTEKSDRACLSCIDTDLVFAALLMAIWRHKPKSPVILHTDQGCQFTSHEWQDFLKNHNLVVSMIRRGNCHDNAVAESVFQLRKRERIRSQICPTMDLAHSVSSTTSRCSTTRDSAMELAKNCLR